MHLSLSRDYMHIVCVRVCVHDHDHIIDLQRRACVHVCFKSHVLVDINLQD